MDQFNYFNNEWYYILNKSKLTPPSIVFSIVWTILYVIMLYTFIIIYKKDTSKLNIFYSQLLINLLWVYVFFSLHNYKISLILLIILTMIVYKMYNTYKLIDKQIGLLQLPYLIWLCLALYLNIYIYLYN